MTTYRDLLTKFLLLCQFLYILHVYPTLPAIIPNHFDNHGLPHRFAPRVIVLVIFLVGAAVVILLTELAQKPRLFNLPAALDDPDRPRQETIARNMLGWLALEIALMFAVMIRTLAHDALHTPARHMFWLFPALLGIIVLTTISQIMRMRRSSADLA
jgi:hypothetical protein